MKYDMAYRRFRHFGKDKVTMDFAFFAIAFNIKKMCRKLIIQALTDKKRVMTGHIHAILALFCPYWTAIGRKQTKNAA